MNKNTLIIVLGVLFLLLLLNTCRLNRKMSTKDKQITAEQLANQKLDSIVNQQKQTIYVQESIIADNTQALNELTDSIFKLKKRDEKNTETIAYYKGKTNTVIRDVKVPYIDSVKMKQFSDSLEANCQEVIKYIRDSTVMVGTKAKDSTDNYEISQTVEKTGIKINSLEIPNTLNLRFVQHKGGLFKRSKIEVQYFNTNPLIKTTSSSSVFYVPKKKSFFTRVVLPLAVGVGAGILITK